MSCSRFFCEGGETPFAQRNKSGFRPPHTPPTSPKCAFKLSMNKPKEWKTKTWGSIATLEYGKPLREYQSNTNGNPVFGTNGKIGYTDKILSHDEGVIIGRKGAYRGVHYSSVPFFVIDTAFFLKQKEKFFMKWAYYALKCYNINDLDSGSAIPSTSREDFYNLHIEIPPLPEQKAIASVLSSLDDKIDLLQRQNATLEAMAETLFRQWFIEEAQEDWEEFTLGCIADNIREQAIPASLDSSIPYIGLEHIDKKNISLNRTGLSSDVTSNKFYFNKYDILFGKLRPYFHKVCLAPFEGVCSTDILVIRAKQESIIPFCLFSFFQKEVIDFSDYSSSGTRMPRTNWDILSHYTMKKPPHEKIEKFNIICKNYIDKILANQKQIRTLENLRDTLLPKLMSREVRVRVDR